MIKRKRRKRCECGCGGNTSGPDKKFKTGHHIRTIEMRDTVSRTLKHMYATGELSNFKGENHPRWNDDADARYTPLFFDRFYRRKILNRDNYECQFKECSDGSIRLCIHHLDYNKSNDSEYNLIAVCASCHKKIHNLYIVGFSEKHFKGRSRISERRRN